MIHSTSPSDRTLRPDAVPASTPRLAVRAPGADRFSAANSAALRTALARHPEVRPEAVAKGRLLASDPGYPSAQVIRHISETILGSPDPADDLS
jgi:hypothetical protein